MNLIQRIQTLFKRTRELKYFLVVDRFDYRLLGVHRSTGTPKGNLTTAFIPLGEATDPLAIRQWADES
jgi:hypothetical protein